MWLNEIVEGIRINRGDKRFKDWVLGFLDIKSLGNKEELVKEIKKG